MKIFKIKKLFGSLNFLNNFLIPYLSEDDDDSDDEDEEEESEEDFAEFGSPMGC